MKRLNVGTDAITLERLRKTKPETLLEASFERFGLSFCPQKSIAGIVLVDIFIEPNICIFIDGDYWHNYPLGLEKDQRQNKLLESWGYKIIRIWEHNVLNNPDLIAYDIINKNNIKIENNLEEYFN